MRLGNRADAKRNRLIKEVDLNEVNHTKLLFPTAARYEDARVVYVHGAFDVFNTGHVEILREAQKLGDFVLVGVHADADVRARRGAALTRAIPVSRLGPGDSVSLLSSLFFLATYLPIFIHTFLPI